MNEGLHLTLHTFIAKGRELVLKKQYVAALSILGEATELLKNNCTDGSLVGQYGMFILRYMGDVAYATGKYTEAIRLYDCALVQMLDYGPPLGELFPDTLDLHLLACVKAQDWEAAGLALEGIRKVQELFSSEESTKREDGGNDTDIFAQGPGVSDRVH
jgi:hypothetical protein